MGGVAAGQSLLNRAAVPESVKAALARGKVLLEPRCGQDLKLSYIRGPSAEPKGGVPAWSICEHCCSAATLVPEWGGRIKRRRSYLMVDFSGTNESKRRFSLPFAPANAVHCQDLRHCLCRKAAGFKPPCPQELPRPWQDLPVADFQIPGRYLQHPPLFSYPDEAITGLVDMLAWESSLLPVLASRSAAAVSTGSGVGSDGHLTC